MQFFVTTRQRSHNEAKKVMNYPNHFNQRFTKQNKDWIVKLKLFGFLLLIDIIVSVRRLLAEMTMSIDNK